MPLLKDAQRDMVEGTLLASIGAAYAIAHEVGGGVLARIMHKPRAWEFAVQSEVIKIPIEHITTAKHVGVVAAQTLRSPEEPPLSLAQAA